MLKKTIKSFLPQCLKHKIADFKNFYLDGYACKSYSQEGEDMILRRLFEKQNIGFYVDVGAHHPFRFSNTYYFYKRGWRGINIDAAPGSMEKFKKARKRDINLEVAISNKNDKIFYHAFDDSALNTFSKDVAMQRSEGGKYKVVSITEFIPRTLEQVLDEYLPEKERMNFLSVDVEGLDFEVLQSNNWEKYRPDVVLVEALGADLGTIFNNVVYEFMIEKKYSLLAKSFNTLIFKKSPL